MIFHASFPAREPEKAARVVARLWSGTAFPFPVFPGSFIAIAGDRFGTAVEFYPAGQVLVPGPTEVEARKVRDPQPIESHLAVGTDLGEEEVLELAREHGWLARTCARGDAFHVIEFWIEDTFMIEVLTPAMQEEYLAFLTPDTYAAFLSRAGSTNAGLTDAGLTDAGLTDAGRAA